MIICATLFLYVRLPETKRRPVVQPKEDPMPAVALIGTFDTKGTELLYVREVIETRGSFQTLLIDVGTLGSHPEASVTAEQIASAAGTSLEALQAEKDRGKSVTAMAEGIAKVVRDLYDQGKLDGVISLGGSAGTTIGTAAMRALPIGVPKVMVSTIASGDVSPYMGARDIAMIYSVVGCLRPQSHLKKSPAECRRGGLRDGGSGPIFSQPGKQGSRAATMFGVTTPCVTRAREVLEKVTGCKGPRVSCHRFGGEGHGRPDSRRRDRRCSGHHHQPDGAMNLWAACSRRDRPVSMRRRRRESLKWFLSAPLIW